MTASTNQLGIPPKVLVHSYQCVVLQNACLKQKILVGVKS